MPSLILGSQSPRRKELLKTAGYDFSVRVSNVDETLKNLHSPEEAVRYLSKQKSRNISIQDGEVLLTADTVVSLDGRIFGKPENEREAYEYLNSLSGKTHDVFTGVTLRDTTSERSFVVGTSVTFFPLREFEIRNYINSQEVWDKAGGYGIQGRGARFVEKICGDYYCVVGLPIARVIRELEAFDILLD